MWGDARGFSMNLMSPAVGLNLARAVDRAVGELRRGVAVVVVCADGARHLALPAETASEATLQECLAASGGPAVLLLARSRAASLGYHPPDATEAGGIALPLSPGQLNVTSLRQLADPTFTPPAPAGLPTAYPASAPAAIALAKLARLLPAMLAASAGPDTRGLLDVAAEDVLAYTGKTDEALAQAVTARVPLEDAPDTRIVAFRPPDGGIEHLAILIGAPEAAEAPLVRVHSECFTGDILGSRRCDCGPQLHQALRRMQAEGAGIILYMAQEGRGIGLVNKLRAYRLQDEGLDTLDANRALGYGADERSFAPAATMLRRLGITRIRLLTNNPAKIAGLQAHGIQIESRVSHTIPANGENNDYLATKATRFGHLLT